MRFFLGVVLALALVVAGCGSTNKSGAPTVGVFGTGQKNHLRTASSIPQHYTAVSFHWSNVSIAGQTGYFMLRNGTQVADVMASPYTFTNLACGSTYTLGVKAHDNSGHTSAVYSTVVTTPRCPITPLTVSGNHLVNGAGQTVILHGMDQAGTEYTCIHGFGIFDAPDNYSFDPQIADIATWGVNNVLIGLNEDCWLGINGVSYTNAGTTYTGAAEATYYQNAIKHVVATIEAHGMYPIVGFFWGAPGTTMAESQNPMQDNDHGPLFWEEVANTFKSDPYVIFRLKEEPYPDNSGVSLADWQCWSQGDVTYAPGGVNTPPTPPTSSGTPNKCAGKVFDDNTHASYQAVGMQSLVNIIRGTGAKNIIQVPGIAYANFTSCSVTGSPTSCGYLDSADGIKVTDTLTPPQLMADVDVYPATSECGLVGTSGYGPTCYNAQYAPVIAVEPMMAGEIGENAAITTNDTSAVDQLMTWADGAGMGYSAWAWFPAYNVPRTMTGPTPAPGWGSDYYNHITGTPSIPAAQPNGSIHFVQTAEGGCLGTDGANGVGTVKLAKAVLPGDDLILVAAGHGYTVAGSVVTAVSDNLNGSWTKLGGSSPSSQHGTVYTDPNFWLAYSVWEFQGSRSAPSGLTITVTSTQSLWGVGAAVVDLSGVRSNGTSAYNTTLQTQNTTFTGPTIGVSGNDVALGLFGAYDSGQYYLPGSNKWYTSIWSNGCGSPAIEWTQPGIGVAASETASIISSRLQVYYGGILDLKPVTP